MPFNSIPFVFFFLIFTALYFSCQNSGLKTFLLIGGSYFFYAYTNIFNLFFLLTTTVITYILANRLYKNKGNRLLFILGLTIILIQLVFTKYSVIVFNEFFAVPESENQYLNFILLPIGISFYSLQAIGLLADIQNRKYQGDTSLKGISQFLSFFPQSISGPIHRGDELIPQFSTSKEFVSNNIVTGFKTILWGYFCKLIIADKIAIIITPVLNSYSERDGLSVLIAALLYSFQIYFDFWGYSLIAIGVGKVLGFTININFINPYSAKSFKDFWHKWHITLSKWMRDYIYIPLGGRKSKGRSLFWFAIIGTFLISGFWHGATFNFVIWGATHAILYLVEDSLSRLLPSGISKRLRDLLLPLWTVVFFILISLTWLIFRTDSFSDLISILNQIFSLSGWETSGILKHYLSTPNIIYLVVILITIPFAQSDILSRLINNVAIKRRVIIADAFFVCVCIVTIILFGDIGGQEFLYFSF